MDFLQNQGPQHQIISAYDENSVVINGSRFSQSLLLLPDSAHQFWEIHDFENLKKEDFLPVINAKPELLIIGTGVQQRFVAPKLMAELVAEKIGIEYMNNQAACRTFNLLLAEGRRVALALFMPSMA